MRRTPTHRLVPAFGHAMHGDGAWAVAGEAASAAVQRLVAYAHARHAKVAPIIEYWAGNNSSYALFVANKVLIHSSVRLWVAVR